MTLLVNSSLQIRDKINIQINIMRVTNKETFVQRASEVHDNKYTYDLFDYKSSREKSTITCPEHGNFEQDAFNHLQGKGCQKCAVQKTIRSSTKGKDYFLTKAYSIHGNKYDYSKVESFKAREKVSIICSQHSIFTQTWDNHVNQGNGCPECAKVNRVKNRENPFGHTKQDFILAAERNSSATLYIIRCYNEHESFYKIGITTQKTVKRRFHSKEHMPYQFEVIETIKGSGEEIWNLEKKYHRDLKSFHYKPQIEFSGSVKECFSQYLN